MKSTFRRLPGLFSIQPDSDDVLLLRPLRLDTGVEVLPVVDPVDEPHGAQGIVAMQIFAVKKGREPELAVMDPTPRSRLRGLSAAAGTAP